MFQVDQWKPGSKNGFNFLWDSVFVHLTEDSTWGQFKLWNTFCGQESNRRSTDAVKLLPQTVVPPPQK